MINWLGLGVANESWGCLEYEDQALTQTLMFTNFARIWSTDDFYTELKHYVAAVFFKFCRLIFLCNTYWT